MWFTLEFQKTLPNAQQVLKISAHLCIDASNSSVVAESQELCVEKTEQLTFPKALALLYILWRMVIFSIKQYVEMGNVIYYILMN